MIITCTIRLAIDSLNTCYQNNNLPHRQVATVLGPSWPCRNQVSALARGGSKLGTHKGLSFISCRGVPERGRR